MNKLILNMLFFTFLSYGVFAQEDSSAKVTFLIGKVSVKTSESNSTWKAVKNGDKLNEGDSIMTGNGSSITLNYKGSEFKLQPNTTILLKSFFSKGKDGTVEVKSGMAWFKLVNLNGQKFNATTPTSTAGVRGTAFATLYDEKSKSAMNCICDGKVEVTSTETGGKPKIVEKGSGSNLKAGNNAVEVTSYKADFDKKIANPSFEKKIQESPMLKNCLSCHTPKGWKAEGVLKDEKYGK